MRSSVLSLVLLVVCFGGAEAVVIWRIAHHPALGDSNGDGLRQLLFAAALPLIGYLIAGLALNQSGRRIPVARYALGLICGLLLMAMSLAQFSHATAGFFFLAIIGQIGILVWATLRATKNAI